MGSVVTGVAEMEGGTIAEEPPEATLDDEEDVASTTVAGGEMRNFTEPQEMTTQGHRESHTKPFHS